MKPSWYNAGLLVLMHLTLIASHRPECSLKVNYQNKNSPLYVDISIPSNSRSNKRLATVKNEEICIQRGESILIGCPSYGSGNPNENELKVLVKNTKNGEQWKKFPQLKVTCGDDQKLKYDPHVNVVYPSQMNCKYFTKSTFHYQEYWANLDYEQFFTLYDNVVGNNYTINIMDGTIDREKNAIYSHMLMRPEAIYSRGRPVRSFRGPTHCPINYNARTIEKNYAPSNHIAQLLRNNPPNDLKQCLLNPELQDGDNAMRISKGHLAASADFVTGPERAATFCYSNTAPQWQITNGGNFVEVEKYVRLEANRLGRPLDVYTGTHGNAKVVLDGNRVIEARSHTLRIPEVFWKILYDPTARSALVFIVFNSPCPWNTVLLNALQEDDSKCSRLHCNTIGLMTNLTAQFDVKGLVFCCESVADAYNLFQLNYCDNLLMNELKLLPYNIKHAGPYAS